MGCHPGAGLGGGSSNAGGLINFLINKYDLMTPEFIDIANNIGSDVPFFVNNKPAKISGVGDIITELTTDNVDEILLAVPKLHINTGSVFKSFDKRVKEALTIVGLVPEHAARYPHEFSGGQKQRIALVQFKRPKVVLQSMVTMKRHIG